MEFELPKDRSSIIKVIGVGGGGSNAVNHMYKQGIEGVDFVICNTDQQALDISPVPNKIQLGSSLTEGRGAGSLPEVGRNAAIENADDIRKILEANTKMVFITAGMGGGTGTGAAPVIASIAKELGILTVGIVTMPFAFEGRKREQQAKEGLDLLKKSVDSILIIKNDKLREIHGNLKLKDAFAQADNVLTTAAKSLAELITKTYHINVDFADVHTVMNNSGVSIMGSAIAEGENRAMVAVQKALESPLLNDNNIEGARYILLNIVSGTNEATMDEFTEITDYVQSSAGYSAELITGNGFDEELGDKIQVTIIATGFKTTKEIEFEHKTPERIVKVLGQDENTEVPQVSPTVNQIEEIVNEVSSSLSLTEEPVDEIKLIQKEEINQGSIEFEMAPEPVKHEIPVPSVSFVRLDAPVSRYSQVQEPENLFNNEEDELSEQLRKSKERVMKLKELSLKLKTPGGITDLEKVPAYVRKNVKLDNGMHSSESPISRYTLSENEEGRPEIKPNNPFLHDKVD